MLRTLRIPAAAAAPETMANAPASSGIAVSMTSEAMSRPIGLCGVMSPYPTVVAVVTAQYRPVV
jgi:hypothetical protein